MNDLRRITISFLKRRFSVKIEWETGRISRSRIIMRQYAEALLGTISTTDNTMRANEKFIRRSLDVGAVGNIFSLGNIGINLEKEFVL